MPRIGGGDAGRQIDQIRHLFFYLQGVGDSSSLSGWGLDFTQVVKGSGVS